ncbi:MAG: hypothetical protein HYS65_12865 [Betaproteobacteria bacterium]|nr:hypothetical protein [Betaproteobacteria bacterium]
MPFFSAAKISLPLRLIAAVALTACACQVAAMGRQPVQKPRTGQSQVNPRRC